jgi:hypothetical protein
MKFRQYTTLKLSTEPIAQGADPSEIKKRQEGVVRVIAHGAMREDGTFLVSLHDEVDDKFYQVTMTKDQLTEVYRRDGIDIVWVDDDFKFGEAKI